MKTYKFSEIISLRDVGTIICTSALCLFLIGLFPFVPMFFLLDWIGLDFEVTVWISGAVAAIVSISGATLSVVGSILADYHIIEKNGEMK